MAAIETYLTLCWNCLGEFDALNAVWCSCDPKNPTKLCPFCFRCFCDASEKYKQEFWKTAPQKLVEEIQVLSRSKDRLGDILIRMKKLTTPQLLEALVEQRESGKKLGEVLLGRKLVKNEDIQAALKSQGVNPLTDTMGAEYAASPVWEQSGPDAIIQYIMGLAAKKGASDVHIEPTEDAISVKYRIDGFFFRVDPIPKKFQAPFTHKLFEVFRLDTTKESKPQTARSSGRLGESEFDFVAQTLPTAHGVSATIKLIDRATFIKDFTTLGLELEDRVRLLEELRSTFGLVIVSAPVFNGAGTTLYSMMNFLVQAQRDVVSLEAPVHWPLEGVRQVEVEQKAAGLNMEETLRSVVAVRPEVVALSSVPDRGTALLAAQLASSIVVVAAIPAQSAGAAVSAMLEMGVPPQVLAGSMAVVTCQRLVRQVCRICRTVAEPPAPQTLANHGIGPEEAAKLKFFRGKGCPTCNKVGYRGRRAIFEIMTGAPEVRTAIQNGMSAQDIESVAIGAGMTTMRARCLKLVADGVTTFDEFAKLRL
ncbi:MAG TPA: ATPase, T2SS/T4P/T4SS family [Vicinamibacteria bacterium]|nr:ATPase, T2SS/T4P/T4SS family [Vicinamibacteria bacterium]